MLQPGDRHQPLLREPWLRPEAVVLQVDKHPPVLLVDGYNVLLKRALLEAEQYMEAQTLADARERLVNDTRDYALVTGCRAVVVFDAFNNPESLATSRCAAPCRQIWQHAILEWHVSMANHLAHLACV